MLHASASHSGMRLGTADFDDAREMCPVCHSSRPRRPVYRVQRDPDIDMLQCTTCGAASASHMPKPEFLRTYYAQYYSDLPQGHTLDDPSRAARHGSVRVNAAAHPRFRGRRWIACHCNRGTFAVPGKAGAGHD